MPLTGGLDALAGRDADQRRVGGGMVINHHLRERLHVGIHRAGHHRLGDINLLLAGLGGFLR